MDATHNKRSRVIIRWIAILVPCAFIALFWWVSHRNAQSGKLVDARLAALRAAGEPIDAVALAKMFPPPPAELNLGTITNNLFTFVLTNRAPGLTPIIMSGTSLARTQSVDEQTLAVLRRFYEDSAGITNVLPLWPADVRFGTDWSKGVADAPIVSFIHVRYTIQMLASRALYAAEVGDAEGVTAMLERSFRFADAISSDATLVEHMIRQACIGLACTITERTLNRLELNDAQLKRVLAAMPPPVTNDLLGTFRVEHCMAVWAFGEVRAGKPLDEIAGRSPEPWWKRTWKRLWPARNVYNDQDFIAYLDLIPRSLATTHLPPREAIAEYERLFKGFQSNVTSEVADAVVPNFPVATKRHFETHAKLEATRAALTIERFRSAHQRLPEGVAALKPSFTTNTLNDLFDARPMRIKPLTRGYVVYSVGSDGKDDGGLEKANSATQTNHDITVTVER